MENWILYPQGPAQVRPGTVWVAATKDSTKRARMLPYVLSEAQAYVIEMGDQYMRFCRNDGTGPAQLLDTGVPVEIASPYLEAELRDVQYVQIISTMYLVHPNHATRKLIRVSDTNWSLAVVNFSPAPTSEIAITPDRTITLGALTGTGVTLTLSGGGTFTFQNGDVNRVVSAGTGRASIVGFVSSTVVLVDIVDDFDTLQYVTTLWSLRGSPYGEITPSAKSPVGGIITIESTGSAEVLTNLIQPTASCPSSDWTASGSGTNEYYLLNTATVYSAVEPDIMRELAVAMVKGSLGSLGIGQWGWGDNDTLGYSTIYVRLTDETDPDAKCGDEDYLQRAAEDPAADLFRSTDVGKYSRIDGIGFVQFTSYVSVTEMKAVILKELDSILPTFDWTLEDLMWSATLGWPRTIALHGDRLFLGGTATFPQTVWGSKVSDYENFTPGANDADALNFTLAGDQINGIQWLKSRNALLIGTEASEWAVRSSGAALTPSDLSAKEQTTNGSERIQPVNIDGSIFFIKRKGTKVPELSFEFASDGYVAPDRTLLADHITEGGIKEVAYAQEPIKTMWAVRNDGQLLGFTFIREEQIVAWNRHTIAGEIESVAVVPHPTENYDEIWLEVKREIDGSDVRYIEVFAKLFDSADSSDAWQVDAGIEYDGAATSTITGLDHLDGETVQVVSNGAIIGEGYEVSGGAITLTREVTKAVVGLAFTATMRKMPMTVQQFGASVGLKKNAKHCRVELYRTIGGKIGTATANGDLERIIVLDTPATMSSPAPLKTGQEFVTLPGNWQESLEITFVQDKPLPMTVLAAIPEGEVADGIGG
jgi:hypothetical protein